MAPLLPFIKEAKYTRGKGKNTQHSEIDRHWVDLIWGFKILSGLIGQSWGFGELGDKCSYDLSLSLSGSNGFANSTLSNFQSPESRVGINKPVGTLRSFPPHQNCTQQEVTHTKVESPKWDGWVH